MFRHLCFPSSPNAPVLILDVSYCFCVVPCIWSRMVYECHWKMQEYTYFYASSFSWDALFSHKCIYHTGKQGYTNFTFSSLSSQVFHLFHILFTFDLSTIIFHIIQFWALFFSCLECLTSIPGNSVFLYFIFIWCFTLPLLKFLELFNSSISSTFQLFKNLQSLCLSLCKILIKASKNEWDSWQKHLSTKQFFCIKLAAAHSFNF